MLFKGSSYDPTKSYMLARICFVLVWFGFGVFFVYFVLLFNLQPAKVVDGYMG